MYAKKDKYFNLTALAKEIAKYQTTKMPDIPISVLFVMGAKRPARLTKGEELIISSVTRNIQKKTIGDLFDCMKYHVENVIESKKAELHFMLIELKKYFSEKELKKRVRMHHVINEKSDLSDEEKMQFDMGLITHTGPVKLDEEGFEIL